MHLDVIELRRFYYRTRLGQIAQRSIRSAIAAHWPDAKGKNVAGYGFAWVGHFVYEKNKPATFTYPFYSLMGDWVMFWEILTGKLSTK